MNSVVRADDDPTGRQSERCGHDMADAVIIRGVPSRHQRRTELSRNMTGKRLKWSVDAVIGGQVKAPVRKMRAAHAGDQGTLL